MGTDRETGRTTSRPRAPSDLASPHGRQSGSPAVRRPGARVLRRSALDTGSPRDAWGVFADELERSRRYGHSFALLRIAPKLRDPRSWDAPARLRALSACLRGVDHAWTHREDLLALLPELGADRTEAVLRRLAWAAPEVLEGASTRYATFPDHGLTAAALLGHVDIAGAGILRGPELDLVRLRNAARRLREHEERRRPAADREPVALPDVLGDGRQSGQAPA
jgi:hypothetical protein